MVKKVKFDIISWSKWRKLNRHSSYEVGDGMFQWKETIRPTLMMNGFEYVGDEETSYEVKDKKGQAIGIIESFMKLPGKEEIGFNEFVYWIHYGSRLSGMPMVLYVFGRDKDRPDLRKKIGIRQNGYSNEERK